MYVLPRRPMSRQRVCHVCLKLKPKLTVTITLYNPLFVLGKCAHFMVMGWSKCKKEKNFVMSPCVLTNLKAFVATRR